MQVDDPIDAFAVHGSPGRPCQNHQVCMSLDPHLWKIAGLVQGLKN